ncbi:MAG: hypothetical protein PHO62_07585 [Sulfurimonas sp.]|uniref:hypothetical protein n=1 Tax=Sulfurimonas sp. TaxID=2022749 RepID=UPI002608D093|nr:hypothetical protein [Sulfurimonas sp.]MDD5373267.1 hypothetical protein [Sulfurimonas sp.]
MNELLLKQIRRILEIEPYDDNGISCCTVTINGIVGDGLGKTFRLDDKKIEEVLNNDNTVIWLHDFFQEIIGKEYLDKLNQLKSNDKDETIKKYQPISIWDYNTGIFNYNIEVLHRCVDSEEEAKQVANYEFAKVGIFIDKDKLPDRKLRICTVTKDGVVEPIFRSNRKILIMKPHVAERLSAPIPIDSEENEAKIVEVLMNMDESYMVTDDDYMEFNMPLERIQNSINITPNNPMLFDSIAYKINEVLV